MFEETLNEFGEVVAPYTGAWIEIVTDEGIVHSASSHPTRVRGLKSQSRYDVVWKRVVAPYTGAWIEITYTQQLLLRLHRSHPTRVRGLK